MDERKRRGPIPRGAFDATLDIMRSSIKSSPHYDEADRMLALHLLSTLENGTLNLAGLATPSKEERADD